MVQRPFWLQKIFQAWEKRSLVWLSGVRRVGKTTLAKMIPDVLYLNCDLPSVQRELQEPEFFYRSLPPGTRIVFDEIHRLENPSMVLKIGTDEFPHLKILATGSSTLAASRKFRDTLTGRKIELHLTPVLWNECLENFQIPNLDKRFLHGGLPEPLLASEKDPYFFSEWLDSFYARDIQELFGIRNRVGFLKLIQLLMRQSGGLADYTQLARLAEINRVTVKAHLEALQITHAIYLLPPFHGKSRRELTRRPKIYAFDTGFVTFARGWDSIREEDRGYLWEHLVLDVLQTLVHRSRIYFWRDKSGNEIDFVLSLNRSRTVCIECKMNPDSFQPHTIRLFRKRYPGGENIVISPLVRAPYTRQYENLIVQFHSIFSFLDFLNSSQFATGK